MIGLWLTGTNRVGHFYPGTTVARPGFVSACHRWTSTILDKDEGPMDTVCPECREAQANA